MTIKANTPNEYRPGTAMRVYVADECSKDGYPRAWHDGIEERHGDDGKRQKFGIKHLVREVTDHRCVRCLHPYRGGGEWSACDEHCRHDGPLRVDGREVDPVAEGFVVGMVTEARWRILTVHHLDGDKLNCRWWNLAALCQRCHLQIQGKVRMERVWPWEHSEWFRPYVAGYYAWAYLREDLTREQAESRLDELLALERADQNPELRPNDQPEAGCSTATSKEERTP